MVRLEKANDGKHKWIAHFKDGRTTRFGSHGMDDYTLAHDKDQRDRYRKRHAKDLKTKDPHRAGYLSYYILWGDSTSLSTNLSNYNMRFNV